MAALEQLRQVVAKTEHVPIHLETDKAVETLLSQPAQKAVFSIVVETVVNAVGHAQADNLYLRLQQRGMEIIAEVEDDGLGFDVAQVKASYQLNAVY